MPKKLTTAPDRLNFLLALLTFLNEADRNDREVTAGEIAKHFDVTLADVNTALHTLNLGGFDDPSGNHESWHHPYYVDFAFDDEDRELPFGEDSVVDYSINEHGSVQVVPQFSSEQVSALIVGLQYLRSLPDDSAQADIDELISLLSQGRHDLLSTSVEHRPGTMSAVVEKIQQAIYNQKRIRCSYQNQKGEKSVREMDPLRIDPRTASWQLRAWCHNNGTPRNFRIDAMSDVEILDADWLPESSKVEIDEELEYRAKDTDVEVIVEADPEGIDLIFDFGGKVSKVDKKTGITTATLQIGFLPYFGRAVARFGGAVRVISPLQAREVVRDYALKALGQTGDRKDVE